jgi:hypothetical protein
VIDQMTRVAADPNLGAPFHPHVALRRIGALGHSAGGLTAAIACQSDPRIKACLNQDGVMHNLPFRRDPLGQTMQQPFMYMGRPYAPPRLSDGHLASMEMSRAQADSLFHAIPAAQDSVLADLPAGGFRVTLTGSWVTHMSFSDEPLIQSMTDSAKRAGALAALGIVARYTRAFFDKTLRGNSSTILDVEPPQGPSDVRVERFRPRTPVTGRPGGLNGRADG